MCRAQAFITVYGTVGSMLWRLALAVYLYYRIVSRDATVTRRLVEVLHVVCYLFPLYMPPVPPGSTAYDYSVTN